MHRCGNKELCVVADALVIRWKKNIAFALASVLVGKTPRHATDSVNAMTGKGDSRNK